ncbi:MAG: flagellar basal body P-ring protein FlgI [Pseudomonadota bacterium]
MKRVIASWAMIAMVLGLAALPEQARATVRIKDIVSVEGIRDNMLIGYGLVVGLNGQGDRLNNSPFTRQSIASMLERLGVRIPDDDLAVRNVAAVMVTANLPPFARQGSRIDIGVASIGDAQDLAGGTLLATPLVAADGEVYALAQGPVTTGAVQAQGQAETVVIGVPTNGKIVNGAIVEREINFKLNDLKQLHLSLRNPDITTARRLSETINEHFRTAVSSPLDPSTVVVQIPFGRTTFNVLGEIEQLQLTPDQVARIVIDESTGIVVMGANVRISTVAVAQGNLTVRITEQPEVVQPNALAGGETAVEPNTQITIDDNPDRKMTIVPEGISLQELVEGMNALGISPREMISILQAIKAAGALQAEITLM